MKIKSSALSNNYHMSLLLVVLFTLCSCGISTQKNPTILWQQDSVSGQKSAFQLTLKNLGSAMSSKGDYAIWFNSLMHIKNVENSEYSLEDMNGNLYRITLKDPNWSSQDSLVISYETDSPLPHISMVPNGFYLQNTTAPEDYTHLQDPEIVLPKLGAEDNRKFLAALYDKNQLALEIEPSPIFPTPAAITINSGTLTVASTMKYRTDSTWDTFVEKALSFSKKIKFEKANSANESQLIYQKNENLPEEGYQMTISSDKIVIEAADEAGAFYGTQSLLSLLSNKENANDEETVLACQTIKDSPRYAYRGLMLDISRNFRKPAVLKKYIDIMSMYKLNKLHLHFSDDEGWRLEIPSLPELTEIGAKRSPVFGNANGIQPSYGSGANVTEKDFLSKEEFQDLLLYAQSRCITIIPEIETPGHARAAVKSMEQRYHRLLKEGKTQEAEKFLMNDLEDKSTYSSAQYWNDNLMNPAMEGTYHFLSEVIDNIKSMYAEVNVPFQKVSIGGDEVPAGAWEKSPKILDLMKQKGLTSVHEVWGYYIDRAAKICESKGLEMAGWEEIGMINKGEGMVVNEDFAKRNFQLDVWNNTIGGGQEDLAYKLANAGYQVVFLSASNYYFDMVWDSDFAEPGLSWASRTDLYHAYSLIPEAYFANILYSERGKKLGTAYFANKERLTEQGKKNFIGLKGALWSETILADERVDHMVFPRFFALAERAWSQQRSYESDKAFDINTFNSDYRKFASRVGLIELPRIESIFENFAYRLPAVGLKKLGDQLLANTEIPGFTIRYTEDGSTPSESSTVFPENGLTFKEGKHVNVAAFEDNGRSGRVSTY